MTMCVCTPLSSLLKGTGVPLSSRDHRHLLQLGRNFALAEAVVAKAAQFVAFSGLGE